MSTSIAVSRTLTFTLIAFTAGSALLAAACTPANTTTGNVTGNNGGADPLTGDGAALSDEKALAEAKADGEAHAARRVAEVTAGARGVTERVVKALPWPSRGFFPGLERPRFEASAARVERDGPKPVLFVVVDTTRADHLSVYGYDRPTTPNLDALADEGTLFTRFYANGAWTRPSISSFMTSQYRTEHGIEVGRPKVTDLHPMVAQSFKAAGYSTIGIVGNQTIRGTYGFDKGFDTYLDIYDELDHNPPADDLANHAIKWVDKNNPKNPNWFMWFMVVDPHDPYNPQPKYDKWEKDLPTRSMDAPAAEYASPKPARFNRNIKALYDAEILQADAGVGKLFDHLKAKGIWDDLTVVVVSDHGEAFGEHNCYRHPYHFWEANIRVPLIIKSPALEGAEGLVEERLFQGIDIAPTMLDLAGVKPAEDFRPAGISIADTLTGPITAGWNRSVFTEMRAYGLTRFSVRRGNMKYLRFEPTKEAEIRRYWKKSYKLLPTAWHTNTRNYLFDLDADPFEKKNLFKEKQDLANLLDKEIDVFHKWLADGRDGARPKISIQSDDGNELDDDAMEDLRSLGYVE